MNLFFIFFFLVVRTLLLLQSDCYTVLYGTRNSRVLAYFTTRTTKTNTVRHDLDMPLYAAHITLSLHSAVVIRFLDSERDGVQCDSAQHADEQRFTKRYGVRESAAEDSHYAS